MNRSLRVSIWALAGFLTACGGGGGGGGDGGGTPAPAPGAPAPPAPAPGAPAPPSPDSFDVGAAWRNFLTTSNNWSVAGEADNGSNYTVDLTTTPGNPATFSGITYATTTTTALLALEGLPIGRTDSVTYFDADTYVAAGTSNIVNAESETCSAAVSSDMPPSAAEVGDSGPLQTLEDLDGCETNSAQTGTTVTTWSLEEEAGATFFCLNTVARELDDTVEFTESDCFEVDQDGTLGDKARITLEQPGFNLVATN
jgi:hypothetical protein